MHPAFAARTIAHFGAARLVLYPVAVHVPVGTQTSAVIKDIVHYRCRACGHRRQAEVTGIGTGVQTFLNPSGTARQRARENARTELRRTIRFATCPACHQRTGHWRFIAPYVAIAGFFVALGIVFGYAPTWFDINMRADDKALCRTYITWGFALFALLAGGLPLWFRWSNNDARIRWLTDL